MDKFSDAVMERMLPTVQLLIARAGLPESAVLDATMTHGINTDRTHWLEVHVLTEDGARCVGRLDPARYGLTLIGDELVTLEDPGAAFGPLEP